MKTFNNVRGTQESVPQIEVNVDTVYLRTDIKRIEEDDFVGWEYNEVQYHIREYIESLSHESDVGVMALMISLLMAEVDMLKSMVMGGLQ